MVNRILFFVMCLIFSICGFSQKVKTVDGEYTYVVPENIDLEKAKQVAVERAKIQIVADEFGTIVSQSNSTSVKNKNGKSNVDFISVGGSEAKGEWLETIGKPILKTEVYDEQLVVKVWIKGKIREIISSNADFSVRILRNGTDDRFEDDVFKNGDDLFLSFQSSVNGYIVIYLVDNDENAFCLLPYQNQAQGNVKVNANEKYVFFSIKQASDSMRQYTDEYTMTCSHTQELNQIYVIFSQNPFVKAVDGKRSDSLPRTLTEGEFQKWLAKCRTRDRQMVYKRVSLVVNQ